MDIGNNTVQNAEKSIYLEDSENLNIHGNMNILSRATSLQTIQNTDNTTQGIAFDGNTFLQRNPDYSPVEFRSDASDTDGIQNTSFDGNTFYPLYKPNNNSTFRSISYGGMTTDLTKNTLSSLDPDVSIFEYFAYKPYTNTGTYATSNLLSNPNFDADMSSWNVSSQF